MNTPNKAPIFAPSLISGRLAEMQRDRNGHADHMVDALRYMMPPQKPLTRWQKTRRCVHHWFREIRTAFARWVAGDEWPEE